MDAHAPLHRHLGALSRRASSLLHHSDLSMHIPSRSIEDRAPDAVLQARSTKTACSSNQNSDTCQKPVDTSDNLPIILGVVQVFRNMFHFGLR